MHVCGCAWLYVCVVVCVCAAVNAGVCVCVCILGLHRAGAGLSRTTPPITPRASHPSQLPAADSDVTHSDFSPRKRRRSDAAADHVSSAAPGPPYPHMSPHSDAPLLFLLPSLPTGLSSPLPGLQMAPFREWGGDELGGIGKFFLLGGGGDQGCFPAPLVAHPRPELPPLAEHMRRSWS